MALDREIAAATAYMEAGNQGPLGRRAVLWVIRNRLEMAPRFGRSVADVALRPEQFSCWNTQDSNRRRLALAPSNDPIWLDCLAAYDEVMNGRVPDPTGEATHYFAVNIVLPQWAESAVFTVQIGTQRFYKNVR